MPSLRVVLTVLAPLYLGLLTGCGGDRKPPGMEERSAGDAPAPGTAQQDSVFAFLATLREETLLGAFERLPSYSFTRRARTEQYDRTGDRLAFVDRIARSEVHRSERVHRLVAIDSGGTFDYGWLGPFVRTERAMDEDADLSSHPRRAIPPYESARNREAYAYRFLPDTVLWGRPVRVAEVRARPDEGADQAIRLVRLYAARDTRELLAMDREHVEETLLFDEESRISASVRPAPGGGWVPHVVRFATRLQAPLRPPQHFTTVSTYSEYTRER